MPLYEYWCQGCGMETEKLVAYNARDLPSCPDCGARLTRKVSEFSWKQYSPFTKDGEGFSSVHYSPEEYRERNKHNVHKHEKL